MYKRQGLWWPWPESKGWRFTLWLYRLEGDPETSREAVQPWWGKSPYQGEVPRLSFGRSGHIVIQEKGIAASRHNFKIGEINVNAHEKGIQVQMDVDPNKDLSGHYMIELLGIRKPSVEEKEMVYLEDPVVTQGSAAIIGAIPTEVDDNWFVLKSTSRKGKIILAPQAFNSNETIEIQRGDRVFGLFRGKNR